MKKLSMNEMNVVSSVIREKINEIKYEKIKGKLEKDVEFKKLEKVNKEVSELRKKIDEKSKLNNELVLKLKNKYNINYVGIDSNNEIKVMFSGNNNYYNDIVLMNLSRELNIDELMNKIVEKYS